MNRTSRPNHKLPRGVHLIGSAYLTLFVSAPLGGNTLGSANSQ